MKFEFDKMTNTEIQKAARLISFAGNIGMDLSGYGWVSVNPNSGYTYLWTEEYNFTLYIDLSGSGDIMALWTNPHTDDDTEIEAEDMSLSELEDWALLLSENADDLEYNGK